MDVVIKPLEEVRDVVQFDALSQIDLGRASAMQTKETTPAQPA
jgi:hypothetical protein